MAVVVGTRLIVLRFCPVDPIALAVRRVEKNLNSLGGHGGGPQILSELAHFSEQSLEALRVCRRGLADRNG